MQRYLDLIHQLLVFDPTLGVRALFGNNSVIARWVGQEVLLVTSCVEIRADQVFADHKLGD